VLEPTNVQHGFSEVRLLPPETDQLAHPEPEAVADEEQGGVAMAMATDLAGRFDQARDLSGRQVPTDIRLFEGWGRSGLSKLLTGLMRGSSSCG